MSSSNLNIIKVLAKYCTEEHSNMKAAFKLIKKSNLEVLTEALERLEKEKEILAGCSGAWIVLWERAQKMEVLKTARPVIVAIALPAETHLLEEKIR